MLLKSNIVFLIIISPDIKLIYTVLSALGIVHLFPFFLAHQRSNRGPAVTLYHWLNDIILLDTPTILIRWDRGIQQKKTWKFGFLPLPTSITLLSDLISFKFLFSFPYFFFFSFCLFVMSFLIFFLNDFLCVCLPRYRFIKANILSALQLGVFDCREQLSIHWD